MQRFDSSVAGEEYRQALASVRCARNVFWWLILAAIVVQLVGFVLVRFAGVVDGSEAMREARATAAGPAAQPAPAPVPAPTTAPAEPAAAADASADAWAALLGWVLPLGKFVALASGVLLVLTVMFAVKLVLLGQTGGVGGLMSAFFWSLLLLVFLIPWQQALPESALLAGALHNLGDLVDATAAAGGEAGLLARIAYYSRFAAYPLIVVLLWLVVGLKFARGCRRAMGVEVAEVSQVEPADDKI
jgi:hypothetical protein